MNWQFPVHYSIVKDSNADLTDLILDCGDVEEDKRARSQINGKVGKNSKVN